MNQFYLFWLYITTLGITGVSVYLTVFVSLGKDEEKKGKRNAALTENPGILDTFNG
jgi:hypothetical protein